MANVLSQVSEFITAAGGNSTIMGIFGVLVAAAVGRLAFRAIRSFV